MTLSARFVRHPRKRYVCDWCERGITGAYVRLYGHFNEHFKPYTLRAHPGCLSAETRDPKVHAALAKAQAAT
jgi:hypothetical protein